MRRGLRAPAMTPELRGAQRLADLEAKPPAWSGDTGWLILGSGVNGAPAFQGTWTNYAGSAAIRRLANGLVIMEGELVAPGGGATLFTLPVGFRPRMRNHQVLGTGSGGATIGGIDIQTTGNVDYAAGAYNVYFPINCTFMASN